MKAIFKKIIKWLLATRGFIITRSNGVALGYISAKETVSAAKGASLSVCDYLENLWGKQGNTQKIIEQMELYGAFATSSPNVVEIGTGTGCLLEKVLQHCSPAKYDSYETAIDWADWLQGKYPITSIKADGLTLRQTPSISSDLIHAHGVFVYLPFLISYGYWKEIWRITKEGGIVAFDIISEECLDQQTVDKWLNSEHNYVRFLSKQYVVSLFSKHGFSILGSFRNRLGPGYSEYLVFSRNKPSKRPNFLNEVGT